MNRTVVIAGGGPTGLTLAGELALAGVPVIVLETGAEPAPRSRGMGLHGRTLAYFQQRGLTDRMDRSASLVWPRTPFALLWLDMASVAEVDQTLAYPQWRTERLLEQWATGLGADVRRGRSVIGFDQDDDGVTVRVDGPGGEQDLRAAYLVGCDGASSRVRGLAGIGLDVSGHDHYGMYADVPATESLRDTFESGLFPTGMAAAMPVERGSLRLMAIELAVTPPGPSGPAPADELRAMLVRVCGSSPDLDRATGVERFGGRTTLADRYRAGRVLLAGDAAHHLFLSGTQGMNAGIQDAANLGWKLAAELNGWAPPGLLDTYESERRPVGERICMHARASLMLLHEATGKMGPLRELIGELLQFGAVNRYLSRLPAADDYSSDGDDPLVGTRIGDLKLASSGGEISVSSTLHAGRGVLLIDGDGLSSRRPDRVDTLTVRPSAELPYAAVLLRPDGYVAYAGPAGEGLEDALETWFGQSAEGVA
ncbi:FAD-dependent monooxygenase [Micromonospora sp. DT233]|uniref:FAD-dependent monooxygenase n=1 Tax=Micromonospora sp. DT233 TaxID=3393432 RepID=UPI003CF2BD5F